MGDTNTIDWAAISAALRAPFDPDDVDFRVQGKANAEGKAQVVTYIDARCVQDRLDEVVCGAWSFTWEPVTLAGSELHVVKGRLTIHGVTREDVGTASNFEASKGAVSDALKRAAVSFGIGRYLYAIPSEWVPVKGDRILPSTRAQLRAKLPRPDGTPAVAQPASQPRQQPAHPTPAPTTTPTPQRPPAPAQRDAGRPTAAPATKAGVSEWLTTDGYDPIGDLELKRRAHKLGVTNMADFEAILSDVRQHYKIYDRAAVDAEMRIREGRYERAQAALTAQRGS